MPLLARDLNARRVANTAGLTFVFSAVFGASGKAARRISQR
ncbi:Uncharacterised protein [Vibrio cholerae]|nr:Uncharacterised protein [Vibrio cholerae]